MQTDQKYAPAQTKNPLVRVHLTPNNWQRGLFFILPPSFLFSEKSGSKLGKIPLELWVISRMLVQLVMPKLRMKPRQWKWWTLKPVKKWNRTKRVAKTRPSP
ncbi:hypothetical protein JTE90_006522 [Oedothorax gibbosus]|uniref:ATP synthase F0 subunit 8 n=1 Tax=Oedothorax gibbosus TaxID=931172 RepID=A0AAV6U0A8_9ARAC|nr:hypothetical protein JTE90_006522 [Oedothorax gibbosus]